MYKSLRTSLLFPKYFIVCDCRELEIRGHAFQASVAIDWQEVGLRGLMLMGRPGVITRGCHLCSALVAWSVCFAVT